MAPKEWLSGLTDDALTAMEAAVLLERHKHSQGPALSSGAVSQEVDRLLAVRDAQRKEGEQQWQAHVVRCLKRRIEQFELGRLGMCSCRECLAGYVSLDVSRMCRTGQEEFLFDARRWQPYTP